MQNYCSPCTQIYVFFTPDRLDRKIRQLTKLNLPNSIQLKQLTECAQFFPAILNQSKIFFPLDNKPYCRASGAKCWRKLEEKVAGRRLEEYHATSIDWLALALNTTKAMP